MLSSVGRHQQEAPRPDGVRNRLLSTLPPCDFDHLRPFLKHVELKRLFVLQHADRPVQSIYFIERGLVLKVAHTPLDGSVELAAVGMSGFVGIEALLGSSTTMHRACVQIAGFALWISISDLTFAMVARPSIRSHLLRYVHSLIVQQGQTALCNAKHDTEKRVARWLLLAQAQAGAEVLPVTQELLAMTLSVRREGVSKALAKLEGEGSLVRRRGALRIRDRNLLQSRSCNCCRVIEERHAWLLRLESFDHRLVCSP